MGGDWGWLVVGGLIWLEEVLDRYLGIYKKDES